MNKIVENQLVTTPIAALTPAEQMLIKGGAACDEKKKRVIVRSKGN